MYYFDDVLLLQGSYYNADEYDNNWGMKSSNSKVFVSENLRYDSNYSYKKEVLQSLKKKGLDVNASSINTDYYAIIREGEIDNQDYSYDHDDKLWDLILVSLLVYPTRINLQLGGRVFFKQKERIQVCNIIPSDKISLFKPLLRNNDRQYLLRTEVELLKEILPSYSTSYQQFPERIKQAFCWLITSQQQDTFNVVLISLTIAIEIALVTSNELISKQFSKRVSNISNIYDSFDKITEKQAKEIYNLRSKMLHSAFVQKNVNEKEKSIGIIKRAEKFLRNLLIKAFIEPEFREIFQDKITIQSKWPVIL